MSDVKSNLLEDVRDFINAKMTLSEWVPGRDWVQYAGPYFDAEEYVAAVDTILKGWLVLGDDAIKFENNFPKLVGKKYGVLTNSGSSANLLMLAALKSRGLGLIKDGHTVITPIAGFPTTINPILQLGLKPIFIDIDLTSLNLNLDALEIAARKYPGSVLIFAHVLGNPPDMSRVMRIVDKYKLILLEDCCDALGSTYDRHMLAYSNNLGGFGLMSSVSFYPAHHMTMGEGGFVATDDPKMEKVLRSLRDWGRDCYCAGKQANLLKDGTCKKRFSEWLPSLPGCGFDHKYVYGEIGYNMKPIEVQASIGLKQMEKLPQITQIRKRNHAYLYKIFDKYNKYFYLPKQTELSDPSWFAFSLTIKDKATFDRTRFCHYLESCKIQTRPYFAGNLMLHPAYEHLFPHVDMAVSYPVATKVTTDTFFLGTSPVITMPMLEYIESKVNTFFEENL